MNITLSARSTNRPAPDRTFALALMLALALEAGLGGLLLRPNPAAPVSPPPARLKVAHIVQIAEAPPPPPPAAAPPKRREPVPPKAPARPAPAPRPAPSPARSTPTAAPSPAPAPVAPPEPSAPATPATPPSRIRPGVRHGVVPLTRVEPDYPPRALANNTEGSVVADLTIEPDGSVSDVRIVRAEPPGIFDRAAEKALRQWKFSQNDSGIVGEVELDFVLN